MRATDDRPARVAADARVQAGNVLLVPKAFMEAHAAITSVLSGGTASSSACHGFTAAEAEWLRQRILYRDHHYLVLNKPPGLAVQVEGSLPAG
jgi:23S rRNA-/tRNA-specific pseudouridylate synthase